jgi:hypothetical protein
MPTKIWKRLPTGLNYGFSGKPTELGWDPVRIARAWTVLMKRLGYSQFVASGGDWGDPVTEPMGGAGFLKTHPLQQARQGRAFRRLGATGSILR